jgi:recombinational DNA repair protein RecR
VKKRKADKIIARRQADFEAMARGKDSKGLYFILQGRGFHKPSSPKK